MLESNAPKSVVISAEIPTYGISQFEWNQNIIALPYGLYTITSNHKGYFNFKKIVIVERQKTKVVSIFLEKIPKLRYLKKWQFTILNIALVADNSFRMFQFINNKKEKWAKLDYVMLFSFPFYHVSSLFLSSKIQNYLFDIKNKESIKDEKRNKNLEIRRQQKKDMGKTYMV